VTVLRAIKAAQRLGFTLDEMRNAVRCPSRTYPAADVDADGRRRLEVVAGS
jgi:hypothetical protein